MKSIANKTGIILFFAGGSVFILLLAFAIFGENNVAEQKILQNDLKFFPTPWIMDVKPQRAMIVKGEIKLHVPKGKEFRMYNIVPDDLPESAILLYRSSQQTMKVTVGDEIVYSYALTNSQRSNQAPPSSWHFIELSKEHEGKSVCIELTSPFESYSGFVNAARYGDYSAGVAYLFEDYGHSLMLSIIIVVLGIVMLVFAAAWKHNDNRWLICFSMFIIAMGVWSIGDGKLTQFLPGNQYTWKVITFTSLMLAPLLYTGFLKYISPKKFQKALDIALIVSVSNLFLQTLGYIFCFFDYVEMLPMTQFSIILTICIQAWIFLGSLKQRWEQRGKQQPSYFWLLSVTVIACVCVIIEMASYYFFSKNFVGTSIRAGILIGIAVMFLVTIYQLSQQAMERTRLNKEVTEYRIAISISQIRPHFLFNTLNSICALIKTDGDEAFRLVGCLAKYLRNNMSTLESNHLIFFEEEELEHIKTYVDIEKVRFGERIHIVYDIAAKGFSVPAMSVQPLVENAIKHGICKKAEGGTVTIRTYGLKNSIIVEVKDNGVGFDTTQIFDKTHIGIENIRFRLKTILNAELVIESKMGVGTTARVVIPKG